MNPYETTSEDTTQQLSYDELLRIIKVMAAYNHATPLEFSQAFLQYADHVQIKIERPTFDIIRITYRGIK